MGIQIPKVKKRHRAKMAKTKSRQKGESPEDKLLPKHARRRQVRTDCVLPLDPSKDQPYLISI
jgi:hypothetical protein